MPPRINVTSFFFIVSSGNFGDASRRSAPRMSRTVQRDLRQAEHSIRYNKGARKWKVGTRLPRFFRGNLSRNHAEHLKTSAQEYSQGVRKRAGSFFLGVFPASGCLQAPVPDPHHADQRASVSRRRGRSIAGVGVGES